MPTAIAPQKAALLLLDFQVIHLQRLPQSEELLKRVAVVAQAARSHGIQVIHCRIAFTSEESKSLPPCFARLSLDSTRLAQMHVDSSESQFHPTLAPQDGDLVIIKKRVGPFCNAPQDLDGMLRERGIDTLIVGGIATGGAVLSTVVEAVDRDYKLVLLEDGCADPSVESHAFLVEFLRKRAEVMKCSEFVAAL